MRQNLEVFDVQDALKRGMDDVAFLKMMLEDFIGMLSDFLNRFERAMENQAMVQLGKDAHQLKGAASSLAAGRIAASAIELEKAALNKESADARLALDNLKASIAEFKDTLGQIDWAQVSPAG